MTLHVCVCVCSCIILDYSELLSLWLGLSSDLEILHPLFLQTLSFLTFFLFYLCDFNYADILTLYQSSWMFCNAHSPCLVLSLSPSPTSPLLHVVSLYPSLGNFWWLIFKFTGFFSLSVSGLLMSPKTLFLLLWLFFFKFPAFTFDSCSFHLSAEVNYVISDIVTFPLRPLIYFYFKYFITIPTFIPNGKCFYISELWSVFFWFFIRLIAFFPLKAGYLVSNSRYGDKYLFRQKVHFIVL